jgi:hypothetical protein
VTGDLFHVQRSEEVGSEDRRRRPNSLADYESDVWKVMGIVMCEGFGDVYYEAVDWRE